MEFANHSNEEGFLLDGGKHASDVIASRHPRKSSLTNNFSYPRPDRQLRRHESSESRSSLNSIPGLTDSSDSEASFDEDYNTSASELWDSFWPDNAVAAGEQYPVLLRSSQAPNYFTKGFPKRKPQETDDTITISKLEEDSKKTSSSSSETPTPQPSPPRPTTRNGTSTYSVYPKVEPTSILRFPLPPRTSSLNTVPASPPCRQPLKPTKSNLNLKTSMSSHNLQPQYVVPHVSKMPLPSTSTNLIPASPAYPPPPPPKTLRSTSSAFNLRDQTRLASQTQLNRTEPSSPLSQSVATMTPEPQPASQSQLGYVSVFELDSDVESYMESNSFKKRIVRGFHKKSASEKRNGSERRGSADSDSSNSSKESQNRKRGGSLGRILGLRNR
ncbi:hypothetical protein M426DRAFT_11304 [Hypoxylon sp. CI-4A]|nr:hypothetical protein M426DRAFT_11304 [Hypoxylon sp. CI-4A]